MKGSTRPNDAGPDNDNSHDISLRWHQ
jgi:hypothetical protein